MKIWCMWKHVEEEKKLEIYSALTATNLRIVRGPFTVGIIDSGNPWIRAQRRSAEIKWFDK